MSVSAVAVSELDWLIGYLDALAHPFKGVRPLSPDDLIVALEKVRRIRGLVADS